MKSQVLQAAGRPRPSDVANESPLMGLSLKRPVANRSVKQLKETTAARDRKQYKALVDSLSFQNRFYHRDFCPGDTLWQYLAVNPAFSSGKVKGRPSRSIRRKRTRSRSSRAKARPSSARAAKQREHELRVLVPDTVVQYPSGSMVWLYTDRNGVIRRVDEFDKETFLERFGNGDEVGCGEGRRGGGKRAERSGGREIARSGPVMVQIERAHIVRARRSKAAGVKQEHVVERMSSAATGARACRCEVPWLCSIALPLLHSSTVAPREGEEEEPFLIHHTSNSPAKSAAITAVKKEGCFSGSSSDLELCKFLGNTTTCLNDRLVREFANTAFQPSARVARSVTIQKFLKSKGRRASVSLCVGPYRAREEERSVGREARARISREDEQRSDGRAHLPLWSSLTLLSSALLCSALHARGWEGRRRERLFPFVCNAQP